MERLKERDDGAFKLSAERAIWHLCTFRARASHARSLPSRKLLARTQTGHRQPESGRARLEGTDAGEGSCPDASVWM
jgi:hypothetical protein